MNDILRIGDGRNKDHIAYSRQIEISKSIRALGVTAALCYIELYRYQSIFFLTYQIITSFRIFNYSFRHKNSLLQKI